MQEKKINKPLYRFPEHFLFWTYENTQLLKSDLSTWDGQPLAFLEKGEPNFDNGPDYLNALLKIGDVQLRGDIEFHIDWQDWYRHGHDADRRYNRVALHVLWEVPRKAHQKLLERFPHFIISEFLNCSQIEWLSYMKQLNFPKPESCGYKKFDIPQNFRYKKLAWQRFQRKCSEIRQWISDFGWETTTYLGLAKVLGYSKNSEPFVDLIKEMPPPKLIEAIRPKQRLPHIYWCIYGWLSGLLRPEYLGNQSNLPTTPPVFLTHLYRQYRHIFPLMRQDIVQWNFARLRPQNNPYFRLGGFCQLVYQFQNSPLFNNLNDIYSLRLSLPNLLEKIESLLCIPLNSNFEPLFKQLLQSNNVPKKTMGVQRCNLFQINFLLPLFYVWAQSNSSFGFARYIEDLYFQFPAVDDNYFIRSISDSISPRSCKNAYHHQAILEHYLSTQLSLKTGNTKRN